MNHIVKIYILLFCSIAFLVGCSEWRPYDSANVEVLEPIVVYPSFSSNYLLTCLSDTQVLESKKFDAKFELAEAALVHGRELDKLHFVCLSLNEKADYKKFKHGSSVLEQYFVDHPDSGNDLQGIQILIDRLDEEIMNRWSAWKSLLNDKKELNAEVKSLKVKIDEQQKQLKVKTDEQQKQLKVKIDEQQKQIEQLKNIDNIIKSRGTN